MKVITLPALTFAIVGLASTWMSASPENREATVGLAPQPIHASATAKPVELPENVIRLDESPARDRGIRNTVLDVVYEELLQPEAKETQPALIRPVIPKPDLFSPVLSRRVVPLAAESQPVFDLPAQTHNLNGNTPSAASVQAQSQDAEFKIIHSKATQPAVAQPAIIQAENPRQAPTRNESNPIVEARPQTIDSSTAHLLATRRVLGGTLNYSQQAPIITVKWSNATSLADKPGVHELQIVVANEGKAAARDVELDAYFPRHIMLLDVQPTPKSSTESVQWHIEALHPGERRILKVKLRRLEDLPITTTAEIHFRSHSSAQYASDDVDNDSPRAAR